MLLSGCLYPGWSSHIPASSDYGDQIYPPKEACQMEEGGEYDCCQQKVNVATSIFGT